ncbi:hypothetical protein RM844_25035 [Streptomyces sp. DSM 44915]|uniref:Uncharacterized protein n=1 Tax=Streptomyces chisholmiae TaxID=3075540 RepID=A0ABU2JX74_9ACTN|nr:hypothetical protein [Streptomyces sp. DSM 44915]MDT0269552.1 hypothetical protein [Streptomyces sp. DSM 44915]
MDYLAALFAPTVMAIAFTCLIVTIVRSQGGANKYKEDAAVDAALAAASAKPAAPAESERGGATRSAD